MSVKMAKNQDKCGLCNGNHYIKLAGEYESILSLYSDPNNFINCPKCTSHLDSRKTNQETRITNHVRIAGGSVLV